jgi:hypothetical protein
MIERRYPAEFSKPEIQIGIQTNINAGANGANGHNLESIVVSDLEFLKLREHENYEHRPRQAREVPGEITIEPALSGALVRSDYAGGRIVSQSQEEENQRRVREVDSRISKLLAKRNGGTAIPEPGGGRNGGHNGAPSTTPAASVNAMILVPITMPVGEPGSGWWAQLTQGDNSRTIAKQAAVYVCQTLVCEVLGSAARTPIDFESELVTLRDLHSAIQDLTGPKGWSLLLKKAGHG